MVLGEALVQVTQQPVKQNVAQAEKFLTNRGADKDRFLRALRPLMESRRTTISWAEATYDQNCREIRADTTIPHGGILAKIDHERNVMDSTKDAAEKGYAASFLSLANMLCCTPTEAMGPLVGKIAFIATWAVSAASIASKDLTVFANDWKNVAITMAVGAVGLAANILLPKQKANLLWSHREGLEALATEEPKQG